MNPIPGRALGAICLFLLLIVSQPFRGWSNDGRDRYAGATTTVFTHVDAPRSPLAGYRVLPRDMRGGADGDPAFRWARDWAVAVVKIAAFRTAKALGQSPHPLAFFDLSAENGDTPIQFAPGKPPRGRHPGASHDGGINLDLGYYLTSERGQHFSPDFAACTNHFRSAAELKARNEKLKRREPFSDAWRCRGPADRLDVARQTYFYIQLFRFNRERFENDLLGEIGIDEAIARAVLAQMTRWAEAGKYGATALLLADMRRVFTSNPYEGWAWAHHHHTHVRFRSLGDTGKYRATLDALRLESDLLALAWLPKGQPLSLQATLHSYRLQRALRVKIIAPPGTRVRSCRYRLGRNAGWQSGLGPAANCLHEFALDAGPLKAATTLQVSAEITLASGKRLTLAQTITAPRKPPFLYVSFNRHHFGGRASCRVVDNRTRCSLSAHLPPAASTYLTSVRYKLFRHGATVVTLIADARRGWGLQTQLPGAAPVVLITAEFVLSGRIVYRVPLHVRSD